MAASDFASLLMGGLQGGGAGVGAAAGLKMAGYAAAGPWAPWLMGGGAAVGALGALASNWADEEDPAAKEERRRMRGMRMFRGNVGRALRSAGPMDFGGMLNGKA